MADEPSTPSTGTALPNANAGDFPSRYKLLEEIGTSGFGVVYAADQLEPMRRRVAIKVVKIGMDTRQVVARFEAERQALASRTHARRWRAQEYLTCARRPGRQSASRG